MLPFRSNLKVLSTSSPKNFSLCSSLGASENFDYNDPTCAEKIRDATSDNLRYAFDTISLEPTAAICAAALSSKGGTYGNLLQVKKVPRSDIEVKATLAYTMNGEYFRMGPEGPEFSEKKEDFEFGKMFWGLAEKLVANGKVTVHPVGARGGGLQGVLEGLQEMREGKVSAEKLVYKVGETS